METAANEPLIVRPRVGGWLALLAWVLVAIGPILRLVVLASSYPTAATVSQDYPAFGWAHATVTVLELGLTAFSIYAGVLLLRVKPGAPVVAIWFLFTTVIAAILETLAYQLSDLPPDVKGPMFAEMAKTIPQAAVAALIWGSYLMVSKRVRDTFARTGPVAQPEQPTQDSADQPGG